LTSGDASIRPATLASGVVAWGGASGAVYAAV